jgi:hypothetical protein
MRMTVAIGLMAGLAVLVVVLIAWLSSRASVVLRAAGALLSGVVSIYCLIYVVALITESTRDFKGATVGLIVIFAATSVATIYAAFRSLRPRSRRPTLGT